MSRSNPASPASSHRVDTVEPKGQPGPGAEPTRDPEIIEGYLRDASGRVGNANALYRPESEADMAAILVHAVEADEPVTVVAGQTSTTASSVPRGGWIVSMERMKRILDIDTGLLRARAEAGVRLGAFQDEIETAGLVYPPDPTSRYECTLGGSVACNASGPRSFHYGATRAWVRGARVVLAGGGVLALRRGEVVAGGSDCFEIRHPVRGRASRDATQIPVPKIARPQGVKHAAGFWAGGERDLLDLFIGSEGTLGVLSEIEVSLAPQPDGLLSILAFFGDETHALDFVEDARRPGFPRPLCIEYFDAAALGVLREDKPRFTTPERAGVAIFFEVAGGDDGLPDATVERWLELLIRHRALVEDPRGVVVAQTAEQREELRVVRHAVPVGVNERAAARGMPKLGTDLSVPDPALREIVSLYHQSAEDPGRLLGQPDAGHGRLDAVSFGHIGDNHIHVNYLPRDARELALARAVYAHLTRIAIALGGSPSAEHGIGKIKHAAMGRWAGEDGLAEMRAIKRALDPASILGRGNLFSIEGLRDTDPLA